MTSRQIVVGYDGSESSRVALTWAMGAGKARGLPVLVLYALPQVTETLVGIGGYVRPPDQGERDAAERLLLEAAHVSRLEVPGVEVETRIVEGPIVPAILGELEGAELAVVGSRGLGTFTQLLVGGTALQLVTHAPCPVVVIRSREYSTPGPEAGRVVVGVDASTQSGEALGFAFEEAASRSTGLTAVHAWQAQFIEVPVKGPAGDQSVVSEIERTEARLLSEALAGWREKYPQVDVRQNLVHGEAAQALVDASPGADLVVVGSRGSGGFRALALGSVCHTVLHHARSAVAVVHPVRA